MPGLSRALNSEPPVSRDRDFRRMTQRLVRYARHGGVTIVLEGESGTGKSFMARQVHDLSPRAARPFQEVSLAALDDGIAGSELFGHLPGAFTDARTRRVGHFVSANGGTLFLDEFGKASSAVQRKLLRVIQTGVVWPIGSDRSVTVDVRLVVATLEPLSELVAKGALFPDLYARLGCFHLRIPPLRERAGDIPLLVDAFVSKHASSCGYGNNLPTVHPDLMELLRRAPWPYNVRQLDAVMLRLLVDAAGASVLTPDLCVDGLEQWLAVVLQPRVTISSESLKRAIEATGSVTGAARELGVHRSTVHRHLAEGRLRDAPNETLPPS